MKNSYYIIVLPPNKDKSTLNEFLVKGQKKGLPNEVLHFNWNLDRTKVIVQGNIVDEIKSFISGKVDIEYLGEMLPNGQAEQKVYDYLEEHRDEWKPENGLV